MSLADDLATQVKKIFKDSWETRDGQVVPEPENLKLGNDAVEFKRATILYADLSGSTALVDAKNWMFAAEVYKSFLHCAAKIIRAEGGAITSYDGDRVMGIFVGDPQSNPAVRCGLKINHAVQKIVNPALLTQYPNSGFSVKQIVGIDTSEIRAARTGVRGGNDIVWVGRAANYAAKLTDIDSETRTWITGDVYKMLNDDTKSNGTPKQSMWKEYKWDKCGNKQIFGSTWTWPV